MPEDNSSEAGLEGVLDQLADYTLNTHNYQTIHNALNAETSIKVEVVDKLLSICIRALKEDMKYTVNTLNIILSVIKKVRDGQCVPVPDLVPSALAVLHLLKTTALFSKVEALKMLCFDIILAYPDETLISLAVNQNTEFMELFSSYCHQRIPIDIRLQPIHLVAKLLKILPPDKRRQFVKQGVSIWFSKIVPTIVLYINSPNAKVDVPIQAFEMLTEELVHIDYVDNPQWHIVLECIYTPHRYPLIMKGLLEKDRSVWYKLWILFIKLLKNQITKVTNSIGSPINSMLPVVEMAFKMNPKNRCQAFKCWNVLIDNFSTETSDVYIFKRIKLLIIPLSSNNAKVVETAVAKLNTWWHLILKFNTKLEKVAGLALIPFLHFCFGKPNTDKPMLIPGTFSDEIKYKCVEALVELFGHISNCDCRVSLPRLSEKLVTQNLLVSHWKDWIHSIENIIKLAAQYDSVEMKSRVKCTWFSLLSTIGDITDSKLKKDMYYEVLSFLEKLCMDSKREITEIILHTLVPSIFDKELKIMSLNMKIEECPLEQRVISILLKLPRESLDVRSETVNALRVVTDYFLEEKSTLSLSTIESVIKQVPSKGLLMWTALAESICKTKHITNAKVLCRMLQCPLEERDSSLKAPEATSAWIDLYNYVFTQCPTINDDIFKILSLYGDEKLKKDFILIISLAMLKQKVKQNRNNEDTNFNEELKFLLKVTNVHDLSQWIKADENLKDIIEVIIDVSNKLIQINDITSVENVIFIIKNILKQLLQLKKFKECNLFRLLEDLFKCIELMFKEDKYPSLKLSVLNEVKEIGAKLLLSVETLQGAHKNKDSVSNIKNIIESINVNSEKVLDKPESAISISKTKFAEPETKTIKKKTKKKEPAIVNTVIDDGEEYVVVKSNWKFNPKKLTDNQKEKFQRKREDIPALYQDLSQSQDEFKLSTWKTDSQDTSSTSKSTSMSATEDVSSMLKNIYNSDIVPKILEAIKPCKDDVENNSGNPNNEPNIEKSDEIKINNKTPTPLAKETKSPRMALKDRVFRNVRNLIENSNVPNGNISLNCGTKESDPKTPISKISQDVNTFINSAPPKISTERPTRQKRKPKKFEDLQIFGLKKRRLSAGQNDSPVDVDALESCDSDSTTTKSSCETDIPNLAEAKNLQESEEVLDTPQNIQALIKTGAKLEQKISVKELEADVSFDTKTKTEDVPKKQCENVEMDVKINTDQAIENSKEVNNSSFDDFKIEVSTPKPKSRADKQPEVSKSSSKKNCSKKSRIEKELAIDTVEGHPLLNAKSEKRVTRKRILETPKTRKSLTDKFNKSNTEAKALKSDGKNKDKENLQHKTDETIHSEEPLSQQSQDVIESSQDSSITSISVKSTASLKKVPIVLINNLTTDSIAQNTQSLLDDVVDEPQSVEFQDKDNKDDTDFPKNKTAINDSTVIDLTENMDTEPMEQDTFDDVIVINDDPPEIVNLNNTYLKSETKSTEVVDTQSMDPSVVDELNKDVISNNCDTTSDNITSNETINSKNDALEITTNDLTQSIDDTENKEKPKFSPLKDEEQRKKDFLNNTIEISPIKTLSPVGENKASSTDSNNDYVVIKLKSPVQSNGEPYEKCDSPEIFTEEQRVSPDKRNLSPPREEVIVSNSSPSSSLSLKKNRPQVRSGGRAAQMLGLCVPNRLQTLMLTDKTSDTEEKKSTPITTSARRNLRILYGSTTENNDVPEENDEGDNFLKLKRSLPSTDCSPAGPILKRKLAEITDDATVSPVSKRKRVSFHDPPVSTTICVKKYIEPSGIRSPQNSAIKRQERQLRAQIASKSPKRLDNLFKLDTVLTKTIESFVDVEPTPSSNDTDMSSQDATPIVEVVKTSELNDSDPICLELINCCDSIENIASDLSSPAMKTLLIKEFEGKINTVGDLAKMTELEINRLCIKAPKVQVARSVLNEYALKIKQASEEVTLTVETAMSESMICEFRAMEVQTNEILVDNVATQTDVLPVSLSKSSQSDVLLTTHGSVQTEQSGEKTTVDLVKSCLKRKDFTDSLCEQTDESFKKKIADNLHINTITNVLLDKLSISNSAVVLKRVIDQILLSNTEDTRLELLKEYICDKFDSKDLILFCSEVLKKAYNKIT